eukprot:5936017-Pleurochrysis_carterae.AAC.1
MQLLIDRADQDVDVRRHALVGGEGSQRLFELGLEVGGACGRHCGRCATAQVAQQQRLLARNSADPASFMRNSKVNT